jgi:hypothetical protein
LASETIMFSTQLRWCLVVITLGLTTTTFTQNDLPACAKASGTTDAARAELNRLLQNKRLTLSMGADSFADRFEFVFAWMTPPRDGSPRGGQYWIARDKREMAAGVYAVDGSPFAYATNGLLAALDPRRLDQITVIESGTPHFVFDAGSAGVGLDSELAFLHGINDPSLRVDLASLINSAIEKAVDADFDARQRTLRLNTKKAVIAVTLAGVHDASAFPVERFSVASKAGLVVVLSNIRAGGNRPAIMGLHKEDFVRTGLAIAQPSAGPPSKLALTVPLGFGATQSEQLSIGRLRKAIPALPMVPTGASRPSTTRPTATTRRGASNWP